MFGWVETLITASIVLLCLASSASGAARTSWPSLLGSREAFSPELSAAIERVWLEPTLSRTIIAPSVRAPLDVYAAFVDTPEVTAAAARFRKIQSYEVRVLDDDRYWGDDGEGARGIARVLRREPRRRIFLSQGEHTNPFLGTIRGSALTILDLELQDGRVNPRLTAYVSIDNRTAATLARLFVPMLGFIADRKLGEGLRVTSAVTEWAVDRSGGFCNWFAHEPLPQLQRDRILAALPTCAMASRSSTAAEQDLDRDGGAQSKVGAEMGSRAVHGELLKLGVTVSQATVSKYMRRPRRPPSQAWRTLLKNHAKDLIALDFFTVPTATFRVLFVFVVLSHGRRRLVHFNVTEHPTAEWTARQLLEVCVYEETPRYLIRGRDQVYGARFCRQAATLDIREVVIAPRSPWQNAYAERVIASIRRECLDHVREASTQNPVDVPRLPQRDADPPIAGQGRARAAQCAATCSGKGGEGSSRRWASSRIFAAGA